MLNLQKDNFCLIPLIPKLQKGKGQSTDASDSNRSTVIEVSLKLESYWFELTSYLGPLCILQYEW